MPDVPAVATVLVIGSQNVFLSAAYNSLHLLLLVLPLVVFLFYFSGFVMKHRKLQVFESLELSFLTRNL